MLILLAWVDRRIITPRWTSRATSPDRVVISDSASYHDRTAIVTRVIDGDTLHIDIPDRDHSNTKVRLLGIDAPELGTSGQPAMYYARQAAEFLERIARNKEVRVYLDEPAGSRDKYGRLLAYIELPDGRFANEVLLSEGYAYADRRFRHSYSQKYLRLEAAARSQRKGLWNEVTRDQLPSWLRERDPNLLRRR